MSPEYLIKLRATVENRQDAIRIRRELDSIRGLETISLTPILKRGNASRVRPGEELDPDTYPSLAGRQVLKARIKLGLSQYRLGVRVGLSPTSIASLEKGRNIDVVRARTIDQIIKALGWETGGTEATAFLERLEFEREHGVSLIESSDSSS